MKNLFLIFICCCVSNGIYAQHLQKTIDEEKVIQSINCEKINVANDCSNAIAVKAQGKVIFTCLPKGTGGLLEFNNNPIGNVYYFEKEHNTIWVRFKAFRDGLFTFKLSTKAKNIDLDFLLYKKFSDDYCSAITTKKIKPVRTNMSRPDTENFSATGLAMVATKQFVAAGKGNAFSKYIKVKKGEEFILAIDKVNEEGV